MKKEKLTAVLFEPSYLPDGFQSTKISTSSLSNFSEYTCTGNKGLIINQMLLGNTEQQALEWDLKNSLSLLIGSGGDETKEIIQINMKNALFVVNNTYKYHAVIIYNPLFTQTQVALQLDNNCNLPDPKQELIKIAESLKLSPAK